MSDIHIMFCEAIEKTMCEELCMKPCERTYEIAAKILETISEMEAKYKEGDL